MIMKDTNKGVASICLIQTRCILTYLKWQKVIPVSNSTVVADICHFSSATGRKHRSQTTQLFSFAAWISCFIKVVARDAQVVLCKRDFVMVEQPSEGCQHISSRTMDNRTAGLRPDKTAAGTGRGRCCI